MNYKKLTPKEVGLIADEFLAALPGWKKVRHDELVRADRYVGQILWLDRLSGGDFRPTYKVEVLVAPRGGESTPIKGQWLSLRLRTASRLEQERKIPLMIAAMLSEIVPAVDQPLDANAIADIAINENPTDPPTIYALACLLAALERRSEFLQWRLRYSEMIVSRKLIRTALDAECEQHMAKVNSWFDLSDRNALFADLSDKMKKRLFRR